MKAAAVTVGVLIAVVGLIGLASPGWLLGTASSLISPAALYAVAAIRLLFGIVLLAAARKSLAPIFLRILGALILVNGIVTLFLGVDRAHSLVDWASTQSPGIVRLFAGLALVIGVFVAYAVVGGRKRSQ